MSSNTDICVDIRPSLLPPPTSTTPTSSVARKRERDDDDDNDKVVDVKKTRLDDGKENPMKVWFLMRITNEDAEYESHYRAPIECKSVKKLKEAIKRCKEMEVEWGYPHASCGLSAIFQNALPLKKDANQKWIIDNDAENDDDNDERVEYEDDVDEDDEDLVLTQKTIKQQYNMKGKKITPFRIHMNDIISKEDRADWEKVDKFNDLSDKPTDVYQLFVLDGWC